MKAIKEAEQALGQFSLGFNLSYTQSMLPIIEHFDSVRNRRKAMLLHLHDLLWGPQDATRGTFLKPVLGLILRLV